MSNDFGDPRWSRIYVLGGWNLRSCPAGVKQLPHPIVQIGTLWHHDTIINLAPFLFIYSVSNLGRGMRP